MLRFTKNQARNAAKNAVFLCKYYCNQTEIQVLKQIEFFIVVKNEVKKEIGLLEVNKTVQYTGIPRKIIKETLNLVSDFIVQI